MFYLSCPSATFALQRGGFVPREWLAAKGLFSPWMVRRKSFWRVTKKKKARNLTNWPCFITCITNIFSVHRIHVYSTRKSDQTGLSYTLGRRLKFEHSDVVFHMNRIDSNKLSSNSERSKTSESIPNR